MTQIRSVTDYSPLPTIILSSININVAHHYESCLWCLGLN